MLLAFDYADGKFLFPSIGATNSYLSFNFGVLLQSFSRVLLRVVTFFLGVCKIFNVFKNQLNRLWGIHAHEQTFAVLGEFLGYQK